MKNTRESYNKEEKQEEDNLYHYKYFFYLKMGNFITEQYQNWGNNLLNIKNSLVNLYKKELFIFFIYSLVS